MRHPEEIGSNVIPWKPTHGKDSVVNFIDTFLKKDIGLASITEIQYVPINFGLLLHYYKNKKIFNST